jgi:hypothetical protein
MKTAISTARKLAMAIRKSLLNKSTRGMAAAIIVTLGTTLCTGGSTSEGDASLKTRLVGTWTTKSFGTQELTNFSDGTARLDVTLNRLGALRYGKSLRLDLVWTVQNGVMRHTVKGGSPPEKVARLVKDWGKTLEYEVIEVTETHILLEKPDEDDQSRWDAKTEIANR